MKKMFTVLFLISFFTTSFGQTQTEFVIGAEWLDPPSNISYQLTSTDWDNIRDIGFNWGMFGYQNQTLAINALNAANTNNVKIMLEYYQLWNAAKYSRRWQYHPEYSGHYTSFSGRIGSSVTNPLEDPDSKKFPDDPNENNRSWKVVALGTPGYIAKDLVTNTEQQDNMTYYVKIRMRITSGSWIGTDTPVVTLKVFKGTTLINSKTIKASDFGAGYDFTYKEINPGLSFYKTYTSGASTSTPSLPIESQPLPLNRFTSPLENETNSTFSPYDYQIYWEGQVTCYVDYLIIDAGNSNTTFTGGYDATINNEVNLFKSYPGLGKFKIMDEAQTFQWLPIGYVEQKIRANVNASGYPNKTGSHYSYSYGYGDQKYINREIVQTRTAQHLSDLYFFEGNVPLPDASNYLTEVQNRAQNDLIPHLRWNITKANNNNVPFWYCPMIDYFDELNVAGTNLREPTTNEIKFLVNLGVAYGAKGIFYFLYWSCHVPGISGTDQYYGLVNEDGSKRTTIYPGTSYEGNKWETVKSINQKLATLGPTLLNLTWQNSYSIIPSSQSYPSYISSIRTTSDSYPTNTYIELGTFKNTNESKEVEYFYIVNRRTSPTEQRNITVTFNKSSTYTAWKVTEIGTNSSWIVSNTGSFTTNYQSGEGKLFKFEPLFLNSTITLSGDVSIPNGNTITIQPGTTLNFTNGSALTVHGVLNAQGTLSNPITFNSGNIIFDGSGTYGSNINYANINNGTGIQCLNGAFYVTIQNSTIDHCTYGVYIYNSEPIIENNNINEPSQNGIYGQAAGYSPYIYDNTITKISNSYHNYQGILFYSNSSVRGYRNDVSGFYWGAYIGGGSNAFFYNPVRGLQPYNRFLYNLYGIAAGWGATITAYSSVGDGGNSIYSNTYYDAYCYNNSTIYGQKNYWGGGYPAKYVDGTSNIYLDPVLTSDPWYSGGGGIQPIAASSDGTKQLQQAATGNQSQSLSTTGDDFEDVKLGLQLEDSKQFAQAISHYKSLINNDRLVTFSLTELMKVRRKYPGHNIASYIQSLIKNKQYGALAKKLLGDIYLQSGKFNEAMNTYDEIISNHPNEYEGINARFEKLFASLNVKKNKEEANKILSGIKAMNLTDQEWQMRIQAADGLLGVASGSQSKSQANVTAEKSEANNLPKEYALFDNYPNPFNPTTVIKYQLLKDGFVTLKIYDMLGRVVATLVNENKAAGIYNVTFNANNLASGIYIYQLKAGSFVANKKLVLMK